MFMTSKSHERVTKALREENDGLCKRIESLAEQLRQANRMLASERKRVHTLEGYVEDQSLANRELFNENRKLDRMLPARDAKGRFCSKRVKLELVA